jgi:hypothetical protein
MIPNLCAHFFDKKLDFVCSVSMLLVGVMPANHKEENMQKDIQFAGFSPTSNPTILPESFVHCWQVAGTLEELYFTIENAWARVDETGKCGRRTFYNNKMSGFRQLRGRATKYRNKGVGLKPLRGEEFRSTKYGKVNYANLAKLAEQYT